MVIIIASEGSIRVVNGGYTYGRVEIYHAGQWGTICHDVWSYEETDVACRQLGFPDGNHFYRTGAYFGQGTGQIWIDNIYCIGDEDMISHCPNGGWGVHNCGHNEDVGVLCDPGMEMITYQTMLVY